MKTNMSIYRRRARLTQSQLAKKLHVTQQFVSSVERGESAVNLYFAYSIAEALGVDDVKAVFPGEGVTM